MTDLEHREVGASYRGTIAPDREEWVDDDYTETKEFFRTSEFWAFVLVGLAVLLAAYTSGDDSISREDGWRFAVAVTAAYLLSRGLAKAGSREPRHR
jgi:hypothetical protein